MSMKCSLRGCPGEYEDRRIVQTRRHGNRIIVINDVPAQVCDFCGDVLLTVDTVRPTEAMERVTMSIELDDRRRREIAL